MLNTAKVGQLNQDLSFFPPHPIFLELEWSAGVGVGLMLRAVMEFIPTNSSSARWKGDTEVPFIPSYPAGGRGGSDRGCACLPLGCSPCNKELSVCTK